MRVSGFCDVYERCFVYNRLSGVVGFFAHSESECYPFRVLPCECTTRAVGSTDARTAREAESMTKADRLQSTAYLGNIY